MGRIGLERTIELMKALLVGKDPKTHSPDELRVKNSLKADIELAKKKGYQLDVPSE